MHIKYTGSADLRIITPEDLSRFGVEVMESLTFPRGVPVEVPATIGALLVGNLMTPGQFAPLETAEAEVPLLQVEGITFPEPEPESEQKPEQKPEKRVSPKASPKA